jgi:hypothetical protein
MAHISLKHVQPGMVLAADTVAAGNRLLLRAGSEITEAHLQTLRMWDVFGVDVPRRQPGGRRHVPRPSSTPQRATRSSVSSTRIFALPTARIR